MWYKHQLELGGLQCKPPERTSRGTTPDWHLHVGDEFVAAVECKTVFPSDEIERGRDRLFRWLRDAQAKLRNKKIQISIRDFSLNNERYPKVIRFAKFLDDCAARSLNIITEPRSSYLGDYQYTDKHGSTLRFGLYLSHDPLPIGTPLFRVVNLGARFSRSTKKLERLLKESSRQHQDALPVVLCLAWNHEADCPSFNTVCATVANQASRLEKRGVIGVYWACSVGPRTEAEAPLLLHWDSQMLDRRLLDWNGRVENVKTMTARQV